MLKLYVHLAEEGGPTKDVLVFSDLSPEHLVGQLWMSIEKSIACEIEGIKAHPRAEKSLSGYRTLGAYFASGDDVYCELKKKEIQEAQEDEEVEVSKQETEEKVESKIETKPAEEEKKVVMNTEPTAESTMPKVNSKALNNYSFFESSKKFVKVLVDIPGIGSHPTDKIEATFKRKSFYIQILDFKGQNFHFGCGWLQHKVQPEHCSYRLKENRLEIKLRKRVESQNWYSLFKQRVVGANGGYETSGDEEGEKQE